MVTRKHQPTMERSSATRATLQSATADNAELLSNLLELYIHDLSAFFPQIKLGKSGRYGYPALASYLAGTNGRWAFLIEHEGSVAGFVLAREGSPASDDPCVLDIAEFFVLRQFRARGVGRAAATLLWKLIPGSWTIRAAVSNPDAVSFWRGAVAGYAEQRSTESERTIGGSKWVVFCFDNSFASVDERDVAPTNDG